LPQVSFLQRMIRWLCVRDYFDLIPWWTFFADPRGGGLYLWYQDTHLDGHKTSWNEVKLQNPSLWRTLWNPRKRYWKMLEDACASILIMEEHEREEQQWLVSQPYKQVLTAMMALPHQNTSNSRQFLLACTFGEHIECVFLSQNHQW
jgi:hypothetical protein